MHSIKYTYLMAIAIERGRRGGGEGRGGEREMGCVCTARAHRMFVIVISLCGLPF